MGKHFKTRQQALNHAAALRKQGHQTRIDRDPLNGNFIVSIIGLGLALGIAGAILRK